MKSVTITLNQKLIVSLIHHLIVMRQNEKVDDVSQWPTDLMVSGIKDSACLISAVLGKVEKAAPGDYQKAVDAVFEHLKKVESEDPKMH